MRKLIVFAALAAVLVFTLRTQQGTYQEMGERRFEALRRPAQEVLVGVCWPFSVNEDGMAQGLEMALDEINDGGLAGDHTIRLVMRDNAFDGEKTRRIAIEFADTPGMSAVIGFYDDAPAVMASMILESSRLLHLIAGANVTAMTSHGFQYIVRTILSGEKFGENMAEMTVAQGYRKVAVLWEKDAFGEDLAYHFRVGLDNTDAKVVYQWSYFRERADFRLPVNELKGIDADVIIFAGLEPWAGDFLRNARAVGLKTPIIGAFSDTPEMRKRAGPGLEGAMYFEIYNVLSQSPKNRAFVRKFRARYGVDPDAWAAQGYDSLHLLAKAVTFTGSRNPLDLVYAIRYMDAWEGANGRYKFDRTGELDDKPLFLRVYKNGVPVWIEQAEAASALGKLNFSNTTEDINAKGEPR